MEQFIDHYFAELYKQMEHHQLLPLEPIVADNTTYVYSVLVDGKLQKATYIATLNPLDEDGPSLFCSYGLINSSEQYTYISNKD